MFADLHTSYKVFQCCPTTFLIIHSLLRYIILKIIINKYISVASVVHKVMFEHRMLNLILE